ncbi:MAG TPA: ribosome biogenesis GTPase Der [Gammaproteobacteria bacterium]|nr:ribosome biogenesis GTPase Der [Gammaproteobacteria bacterium]HRA42423.1 ribosome biogenesis GTPase Der [Gammaproteobacteria bacterium]
MLPVIAIVGRPNVGKSTLFNQLTKSREALVVDLPGVTRDRQYGEGKIGERPFIAIDTGGLGSQEAELDTLTEEQSWQAVVEADIVLFIVDGRTGLMAADKTIAQQLRVKEKAVYCVVNKTDGLNPDIALADFYALGLGDPIPIAASQARGLVALIDHIFLPFPPLSEIEIANPEESGIKIAIAGRPNVGKSTLVNRLLGEDRVIVFDQPGTTRDSIYIPLERAGKKYTIIDTAGVRRRSRVSELVEKFSVVKTLQAIEDCHVVILVVDAVESVTDQDLGLLGFVLETGRSLVLAINKWDGLDVEHRENVKKTLNYRLKFADFAKVHYISALHGSGVGNLFDSVQEAFQSSIKELSTAEVNRVLEIAVTQHPPPMFQGRRIKLRYAHTGGHRPPLIIIHGNQTEHVPESYKRYLINTFRKHLKIVGTPIRVEFKTSANPFAGRRNTLTPRQLYKRQRLMRFAKKKK